jgi:hypothetical protein
LLVVLLPIGCAVIAAAAWGLSLLIALPSPRRMHGHLLARVALRRDRGYRGSRV